MAELAYPGTDRYSMAELMAILLARMAAGEAESAGGGGANQIISLAGNRLAQLTTAPNVWLFTGGAGVYNGKFDRLPLGTWDSRCGQDAECKIPLIDVADVPHHVTFMLGDGGEAGLLELAAIDVADDEQRPGLALHDWMADEHADDIGGGVRGVIAQHGEGAVLLRGDMPQ